MSAVEAADKTRRHEIIRGLVEDTVIASQDDLARALRRCGVRVTQATLSRDLKELGMLRVPTGDGYRYAAVGGGEPAAFRSAPASAGRMRHVAVMEVLGVDHNEAHVVVRTLTGRAQGVAVYLDGLRLPDVLGTIAGDDTILVLPRSIRRTARVARELAAVFGLE